MALNPDLTSRVQQGVGATPRADCHGRAAVSTKTPRALPAGGTAPFQRRGCAGGAVCTPAPTPLLSLPPVLGVCGASRGLRPRQPTHVGRTGRQGTDRAQPSRGHTHDAGRRRARLSCPLSLLGAQAPNTEHWSPERGWQASPAPRRTRKCKAGFSFMNPDTGPP